MSDVQFFTLVGLLLLGFLMIVVVVLRGKGWLEGRLKLSEEAIRDNQGFSHLQLATEEELLEYESSARLVVVITESLKFETRDWGAVPFVETARDGIIEGIYEKSGGTQYRFVIPESKADDLTGTIRKVYLEDQHLNPDGVDAFLAANVKAVEDSTFSLFRPFPERTFFFEGDLDARVCDIVGSHVHRHMVRVLPDPEDPTMNRFEKAIKSMFEA